MWTTIWSGSLPSQPPPEAGLIHDETGAQTLLGYVVDVSDGTQGRCWLDVGPQHTNRIGTLHGGIVVCLLDNASGVTGALTVDPSGRAPFMTVSMNTQFIAAGRTGRVTATGKVVGGGRKLLFIDAELRHEDGTLIATSSGVFKRVPEEKRT